MELTTMMAIPERKKHRLEISRAIGDLLPEREPIAIELPPDYLQRVRRRNARLRKMSASQRRSWAYYMSLRGLSCP